MLSAFVGLSPRFAPDGSTRLEMREAGVKEFLDLLDSRGSNPARER